DDPDMLELASQYARLFLNEAGKPNENLFKIIPLKNGSAEDAAREITELFNGPTQGAQGQGGPGGGRGGGGMNFGGGLGMLAQLTGMGGGAAAAPAKGRVHVV